MRYLILFALCSLAACDVNITQQPVSPATSSASGNVPNVTPVIQTTPQSCPSVLDTQPDDLGIALDGSYWECVSNCTQIPFMSLLLYLDPPGLNGWTYGAVTAITSPALRLAGTQTTYWISEDQHHNIFTGNNMVFAEPRSPTWVSYPSSLDCDQLTINGAVFQNKTLN